MTSGEKRKQKLELLEQLVRSQRQASIPEVPPSVPIMPTGTESIFATQVELPWTQGSQPIPTDTFEPIDWNYYKDTTLSDNHVLSNNARNWHYETQLHSTSPTSSTLCTPDFGMIFNSSRTFLI